jgi:hypothetical protein
MSYTQDVVIDEMNKQKERCTHQFQNYECVLCGASEKVTCYFCGHVTDLEESEGEVLHWSDCHFLYFRDEDGEDPSEQYARDQYLNK